ncbi:hypothetical protein CVS40_5785, partial [Lucilia cuprina]
KISHINSTVKNKVGITKCLINSNSNSNKNNWLWHENCKKATIVCFNRIARKMNILRINGFLPLLVIIGFMATIMVAKGYFLKREQPGLMKATQFYNDLDSYFMADKLRMRRQLGDIPAPPDLPHPPGL